ncbi:hypothetical protein [Mesorhizobium sp. Cs1321R2N1]|uniref:hypothetical protein n=1 Tax=Mesorhizobium sp. Cs1321R2N1 TaxID=3015174 RepID=UPI00301D5448
MAARASISAKRSSKPEALRGIQNRPVELAKANACGDVDFLAAMFEVLLELDAFMLRR